MKIDGRRVPMNWFANNIRILLLSMKHIINYLCSTPHNLPPSSCYVHRVRRVCNCVRNPLILPTTTDRTNSEMKFANKHWPKSQNDTTFIWTTNCVNACDRWCLAQRRYLRVAFLRLLIWSELGRSTEVHWRMRGVEGEKLPATMSILTIHNLLAPNYD